MIRNWDTLQDHLADNIAMPDDPGEAADLYFEKSQETPWDEYLACDEWPVGD
jgi:hypothetical protein